MEGVELIRGNQVDPYHLLRYEAASFRGRSGKAAGEAKGFGWQEKAEVGVMNQPIRSFAPDHYREGLGIKELQRTLVLKSRPERPDRGQEAVQSIFKVKVNTVRTANFPGKERRRGRFVGYRPDWKKAYVRLKSGEKMPSTHRTCSQKSTARSRTNREFMAIKTYRPTTSTLRFQTALVNEELTTASPGISR